MDGWPQFSDAIVDYYFGKKLAYWYIRRVQQPVCMMVDEPESWHCRWSSATTRRERGGGTFRVTDAASGEPLLSGRFAVEANAQPRLGRLRVSHGEHGSSS